MRARLVKNRRGESRVVLDELSYEDTRALEGAACLEVVKVTTEENRLIEVALAIVVEDIDP